MKRLPIVSKGIASSAKTKGLTAALLSAFFLGMAPIFGKQAILLGMPPLAVVAIRTTLAALLLLVVMFLFYRPFLFIYPAGLLGCLLAGWVNGLGSLFYYSALGRIGAGLGQLLYSLYPLFLILWLTLDNQPPSRLTLLRLGLAIPAIFLLMQTDGTQTDIIGIIEMLIASALYALHVPINQRVLYDMPAPTVTLYTLLSMSAVVVPTFIFSGSVDTLMNVISASAHSASAITLITPASPATDQIGWQTFLMVGLQLFGWPLLGLTLVTFFSRITLFVGVKHLGGMQTALLGLSELLVTVILAQLWLNEHFTSRQWLGAIILMLSLILVAVEKTPPRKLVTGGFLSWLRPAGLPTDTWGPHE